MKSSKYLIRTNKHGLDCFSKSYFDTNGGGDMVIVGASVYGVISSLEQECVFVDGYIMDNMVLLVFYIALFPFKYNSLVGS